MTNAEKAREICGSCPHCTFSCGDRLNCGVEDKYDIAMEMAKWKDEQFAKEKQALIDKACEWLKDMAWYYHNWEWNGDTYEKEIVVDVEKFINDFKKAMEEEEEEEE